MISVFFRGHGDWLGFGSRSLFKPLGGGGGVRLTPKPYCSEPALAPLIILTALQPPSTDKDPKPFPEIEWEMETIKYLIYSHT